ncbi:hypothetical protein CHUAL_013574 [Chamberlinius hualienensis]
MFRFSVWILILRLFSGSQTIKKNGYQILLLCFCVWDLFFKHVINDVILEELGYRNSPSRKCKRKSCWFRFSTVLLTFSKQGPSLKGYFARLPPMPLTWTSNRR